MIIYEKCIHTNARKARASLRDITSSDIDYIRLSLISCSRECFRIKINFLFRFYSLDDPYKHIKCLLQFIFYIGSLLF